MSTVHCKDPRTGIVYVYESENIWDEEAKKYRPRRKCIGKLDESGNVVKTGRPGRPRKKPSQAEAGACDLAAIKAEYDARLKEQELKIHELESALARKQRAIDGFLVSLNRLTEELRTK